MSENKITIGGSVIPSVPDAPMDIRTRVNTIDDIYNIELPYIGMIVYVINEDKYYKIKTLKAKEIAGVLIENSLVDTFEEFNYAMQEMVIALQQEIAELRTIIEELKNNELPSPGEDPGYEFVSPEIVKVDDFFSYIIASGYNSNDLSVWSEAVVDKNVTGLIIRPDIEYNNLDDRINFYLSADYMNNEYYIKNDETNEEETFTKIYEINNVHLNVETGNDYLDKILNEHDQQKNSLKCEDGSELYEQVMSTFIHSSYNYWSLEGTGAKCDVSMDLIVRYAPPIPTDIYRTIKVTYSMYL